MTERVRALASAPLLTFLARARLAMASLAVAMVVLATFTPVAAQAQTFDFSNIIVEGNQRISDGAIRSFAELPTGQGLTAGEVNDALQRLQRTGIFQTVELTPQGGALVITVQEYPTINQITIEGNQRIDDEPLLELITSTPRRTYIPSQAEQDANAIADAYRVAGRLPATVTPRIIPRSNNRVDLVFEVLEGRVVETERISFVGNRSYSDNRLRRVLQSTQAGIFRQIIQRDTFIAERIELDRQLLTNFYLDRGFIDFEILSVTSELSRERDAYFVTFNIREGQSFRVGDVSVISELAEADEAVFRDEVVLQTGQTYSERNVERTITRLGNLATQEGLRFVDVEPRLTRNDETQTLDVQFALVRAERRFVDRINIAGNTTTLDRVIRREFDVVEGDPFDPRSVRASTERIRALGFFSEVDVRARQGRNEEDLIVDVNVVEQPTGSLGIAASFSTDTGPGISLEFSEANFLGRGQELGLAVNTTQGSRSLSFDFTEPDFLRRDLSLAFQTFYTETTDQNRDFDTLAVGFQTVLGFSVSEFARARVGYGLRYNEISGLSETDSSPILLREPTSRLTSYLIGGYVYDTRGVGINPNAGIRLGFTSELAGVGGNVNHLRTTALGIAERRVLREEVTLRASLEGGVLTSLDSANTVLANRFFLSSRQMRGFEPQGLGPRDVDAPNQDALGGNRFAVARLEAAFPLGLPDEYGISGGVFADLGSVWSLDDTDGASTVDDSMILRSTIGVSVFWETILGPLRLNFSRPLLAESFDRTRNFELTIEARF